MHEVVAIVGLSCLAVTVIAIGDPLGLAGDGRTSDRSWIALSVASQAWMIGLPVVGGAMLVERFTSYTIRSIVTGVAIALPVLMMLDCVTWRMLGDHLISAAMWRAVTELRDSLSDYASVNVLQRLVGIGFVAFAISVFLLFFSSLVARQWANHSRLPRPLVVWGICTTLAIVTLIVSMGDRQSSRTEMIVAPFRHPFCVLGVVRHRADNEPSISPHHQTHPDDFAGSILRRQQQQRLASIQTDRLPKVLPDVLLVVIESFRRELLDAKVMPNLATIAEKSIVCKTHFSGGNATNHGVFSLVNGLEAIWHETPVRYTPLINRVLRQAGYELGFFGGHDDWRKFQMDGYISSEHYDSFQISRQAGLQSDRQAAQLAAGFLQRRTGNVAQRKPRFAVLYLYSTHAPYYSYANDQVFQEAADDRFLIPYPISSQPYVWNRYKNSARSVDRLIEVVHQDDQITIVTGDHGEAFLEDTTIGHGIRISEYQNMTPMVISIPGQPARRIDLPTMHADILPTLLAALQLRLTETNVLDGVDLASVSEQRLSRRLFATRNYLKEDVAIIGPWTIDPKQPFAYTASVSLSRFHAGALWPIDPHGMETTATNETADVLRDWLAEKFP